MNKHKHSVKERVREKEIGIQRETDRDRVRGSDKDPMRTHLH